MKASKFFAVAMAAAMMVGFVACGGNKEKEPEIIIPGGGGGDSEEMPEVNPTEGKITVVVNFGGDLCTDIVLAGSYVDGDWGINGVKMENITKGWFKAVIEGGEPNEDGFICEAKPVQLQKNGTFAWGGQWYNGGAAVEILDGAGCNIKFNESNGESQMQFTADAVGQVIYFKAADWESNPCSDLGAATEAYIKHASADEAENWVVEKMDAKGNGVFEHAFVYSESGVNIGVTDNGMGMEWYDTPDIEGIDAISAGDEVVVTFTSENGAKGKVAIAKK